MSVMGYSRINGKETMAEDIKNQEYWLKRRKNNEAARRSREKRRINDIMLERRVMQLSEENKRLRTQLMTIKIKYGEMERLPLRSSPGCSFEDQELTSPSKSQLFTNTIGDTSATVLVNNSGQKCASLLSPMFFNKEADIPAQNENWNGKDLYETQGSPQSCEDTNDTITTNKEFLRNYLKNQASDIRPTQSQTNVMRAIQDLYSLCGHIMRENLNEYGGEKKEENVLSSNEIKSLDYYQKEKERLNTLERLMSFYNRVPSEVEKSISKSTGRVSPYPEKSPKNYPTNRPFSFSQQINKQSSPRSEIPNEKVAVSPILNPQTKSSKFQLPYKLRIKQTMPGNELSILNNGQTNKSENDLFSMSSSRKVQFLTPVLYPKCTFPEFATPQYTLEKNRRYGMYL